MMKWIGSSSTARRRPVRAGWAAYALVLAGLLAAHSSHAQSLQDDFANRVTFTSESGEIDGHNLNATVEPGEPRHAGKTGGRSVWMSWIASADGIVKFEVDDASFDTLLAAYYLPSADDITLDRLVPVMAADDSEDRDFASEIEFGVLAGRRYEIAVDGYFGASGSFEFEWEFKRTSEPPPIVLSTPPDQSVNLGDPLTLTVSLANAGDAEFEWYFNGEELEVESPTLFIPSVQLSDVGRYKLRIHVSGLDYFAFPTEIQINTDGATDVLARDKLLDAPDTPLIGQASSSRLVPQSARSKSGGGAGGVLRGYNGSQIFNTTYSVVDTNEPPHCGLSNGPSYWLSYQPPVNGLLTLDTVGSSYDTVLEVYTFDGALNGYQDLISLACNIDAPGLNGASRVTLPVVNRRQYLVVVQGVNGARGTAWINYNLDTNQPPQAPMLLSEPAPLVVAPSTDVRLSPEVGGTLPLHYSWMKDSSPLAGQTGPAFFLPEVTSTDSANYVVTITNGFGSLTVTLPLRVVSPPRSNLLRTPNGIELKFPTMAGLDYAVEEAAGVLGPWQPVTPSLPGDGSPVVLDLAGEGNRFFRVRVE